MSSFRQILYNVGGGLHLLYLFFVLLPYYYIESLVSWKKIPKSVKGEVVLITGTGHGIGRLLAIKYAKEGATVVAWDVNEELNTKTIQHIKKLGYSKIFGYTVDVTNREQVMATAQQVQKTAGDVTILINNAGIMPHHSFLDHTEQEIRKIMDINVMGNFWTLQAFLPTMKKNNKGHVVALSSMAGLLGLVYLAPYNASKFAVRGLMEGLYEEFRRYPNNNIQFTTIYPHMTDTGLCKAVNVWYPWLSGVLKPEFVAEKIFEAQVYNKRNVRLPAHLGALVILQTTLAPQKAANYAMDYFKTDMLSDLELTSNSKSKEN